MARAYIGLGANLGDPPAQLREALRRLGQEPSVAIGKVSALYRTDPMGPPGQPDYCNAVAAVDTALSPQDLLRRLVAIEDAMGKQRGGRKWGARRIDLDLLLYENHRLDTRELKLPHPGIAQRNFVLLPLIEIEPDISIPRLGPAAALLERVGRRGITPWRTQKANEKAPSGTP